jgi:hypothetical protein
MAKGYYGEPYTIGEWKQGLHGSDDDYLYVTGQLRRIGSELGTVEEEAAQEELPGWGSRLKGNMHLRRVLAVVNERRILGEAPGDIARSLGITRNKLNRLNACVWGGPRRYERQGPNCRARLATLGIRLPERPS